MDATLLATLKGGRTDLRAAWMGLVARFGPVPPPCPLPRGELGCESNFSAATEPGKPADTEGKKQYDRDFLLDFQFMPACIQKPEGLPPISDVVLDKVRSL